MPVYLAEAGQVIEALQVAWPTGKLQSTPGFAAELGQKAGPTFDVQGAPLPFGPWTTARRVASPERPEARAFCNFTFTFETFTIQNV